jgi:hypothetical protein
LGVEHRKKEIKKERKERKKERKERKKERKEESKKPRIHGRMINLTDRKNLQKFGLAEHAFGL